MADHAGTHDLAGEEYAIYPPQPVFRQVESPDQGTTLDLEGKTVLILDSAVLAERWHSGTWFWHEDSGS